MLLTTRYGLMRLVSVLATSGEMRLQTALRHVHYAFRVTFLHMCEPILNITAIAELQSGSVLVGSEVFHVCVLP